MPNGVYKRDICLPFSFIHYLDLIETAKDEVPSFAVNVKISLQILNIRRKPYEARDVRCPTKHESMVLYTFTWSDGVAHENPGSF